MTPIGPVTSAPSPLPITRTEGLPLAMPEGLSSARPGGFGNLLDGLVGMVNTKDMQAQELTKRVLLGESGQLHQSVIAVQEASTAFSLMVQVRNKLVDSYQELMRMQV